MNILKAIFSKFKDKQRCCDIKIVEVKESEKVGNSNLNEECCAGTTNRDCC